MSMTACTVRLASLTSDQMDIEFSTHSPSWWRTVKACAKTTSIGWQRSAMITPLPALFYFIARLGKRHMFASELPTQPNTLLLLRHELMQARKHTGWHFDGLHAVSVDTGNLDVSAAEQLVITIYHLFKIYSGFAYFYHICADL